jgi:hypothetical protein
LEGSIARQHELCGFAKQQTDDLNLALAASAEEGRLRGAVLADVESSIAALAREQQAVRARTEEARRYAEGVRQYREAWVQRKEKPPLATDSDSFGSGAEVRNLAELLERVTASASTTVDHKHSAGAATEDGSMAGDHAALASLTTSGMCVQCRLFLADIDRVANILIFIIRGRGGRADVAAAGRGDPLQAGGGGGRAETAPAAAPR